MATVSRGRRARLASWRAASGFIDAFLAAAREGDFDRLVAVLDPDLGVDAVCAVDDRIRQSCVEWLLATRLT